MKNRPEDLPEHISEKSIGHLFQSRCEHCEAIENFNSNNLSSETVVDRMKEFRVKHANC